jgi:hypothetical protein
LSVTHTVAARVVPSSPSSITTLPTLTRRPDGRSSLLIVPVPVASAMLAFAGLDSCTSIRSSGSAAVSALTGMLMYLIVGVRPVFAERVNFTVPLFGV